MIMKRFNEVLEYSLKMEGIVICSGCQDARFKSNRIAERHSFRTGFGFVCSLVERSRSVAGPRSLCLYSEQLGKNGLLIQTHSH